MNLSNKKIVWLIVVIILNSGRISFGRAMVGRSKPVQATPSANIINNTPVNNANKEFERLVNQSALFDKAIGTFPTTNNRIEVIADQNQQLQNKIVAQAQSTYPLIHQNVRLFLEQFLRYKKQNGTSKEKALYATMNREQFLIRLLEQRPLMFMTENDQYLLRSDKSLGYGGFEAIGTDAERSPLILKDYLSYDEMAVAALVGLSSPTCFINNGDRSNKGIVGVDGSYEKEGIYAGLVGARFEKPGYMEWQHMMITPEQNIPQNGYGLTASNQGLLSLWSNVYGEKFPTFVQAKADKSGKYVVLNDGSYFNTSVYKKRIRLVVEPFLVDANHRALLQNTTAYVHVVGLGLGVWQIDQRQVEYMFDVYAQVLRENDLAYISDIDFSWFGSVSKQYLDKGIRADAAIRGIQVHFSQRNPADKLTGKNFGKLLVAMYAWDGNAYPGNEYWAGMLTASGDPAAACCSTIPELQNPKINHYIKSNITTIKPVVHNVPLQTPVVQNVPAKKVVPAKKARYQKRKAPARQKQPRAKKAKKINFFN